MTSLHLLLLQAQSAMQRTIMSQAAAMGLTSGQPKVLEFLLQAGECNQKTIAAHCEIEPATVGSILMRMEREDLIARSQRDGNRRSLYVTLTPKGRAAAERMAEVFRGADETAAAGLTASQREDLCRMLQQVCRSLNGEGENE